MKLLAFIVGITFSLNLYANNPFITFLIEDILPTLQEWGKDAELVAAVKEQNAKGMTLDAIKARDQSWRNEQGIDAEMQAMMESPAAVKMKSLEGTYPYLVELFLMDNQGANVAMTNKTSDYWQGDEDKWTESFNNGKGGLHIGEVEYDESVEADLIQVSIPVADGDTVVGAMTIGINLNVLRGD